MAKHLARERAYILCYGVLVANALPPFISDSLSRQPLWQALFNLFDISAIIWLAIAAGCALQWRQAEICEKKASGRDYLVFAGAALAALLPIAAASGVALSMVAIAHWLGSPALSNARRAAAIFLSLSCFLFWGRLFLAMASGPLLSADATLVATLAGVHAQGNVVNFVNGQQFVIAPGCSSLHGISLALVMWTTVWAWFGLSMNRRMIFGLGAAVLATIAVNCLRLAVIAWNPAQFDYWHIGTGAAFFGWMLLLAIGAALFWVVRGGGAVSRGMGNSDAAISS